MLRRWIALFLLCWMPLLNGYAVAAGYCLHEAAGPAHFGHHEHQHEHDAASDAGNSLAGNDALAVSSDAPPALNPGGIDFDCGHSHAVQAGVLPSLASLAPLAPRGKAPPARDDPQTSNFPDALERVPLSTPLAFA